MIQDAGKSALNNFKGQVPNHVDIPNSPFAVSLSFPNIPKLTQEEAFFPVDGTIYLKNVGYNPKERTVSPMPLIDETNQNNIQVFINEYMFNTMF